VKLQTSGKTWGERFAAGIRSSKRDVQRAWQEVMQAVKDLTPSSPAKKGPLAYDVAESGLAWAARFAEGLAAGGFPSSGVVGSPGRLRGSSLGSGGGGRLTITVPIYLDGRKIEEQVYDRLLDRKQLNVNLGLA